MSAEPTATPSSDVDEPGERNRRLLMVLGVVVAVSALVAGAVVFSSGPSPKPPVDPQAPVRASDTTLVVGQPSARTKVIVYEDFTSTGSREFEIASRDFLRVEAGQGHALVEYHPVTLGGPRAAGVPLAAWEAVLEAGSARQALALHDLMFDRQIPDGGVPAVDLVALAKKAGVTNSQVLETVGALDVSPPASTQPAAVPAGVRTTPTVLINGKPVTAPSPTALADEVQRTVLAVDR
jgi:protein-disulfide isomerase